MNKSPRAFKNGQHDLRRGIDFIGVTCSFICHDGNGQILMHKRSKNCRDEHGTWDIDGGAHEFGDRAEQTIIREIKEEYGTKAFNLQFIKVFDAHRQLADGTPTHWVSILYAAQVDPKKAKNNEPFKIDEIGWFSFEQLPSPLHSQAMHELQSARDLGII